MLQLYPELQGSQEFHPGKSSLFFLSLENSASTPLVAAAVHTHTHPLSHSLTCEDRYCILQSFAHTSLPCVVLRGPAQTANTAFPGTGRPDQVSSTGVAGVITYCRGSGLAPECMAADMTRHASSDSLTPSLIFSFCLFPFYLPSLILASYFHSISWPLPSPFRLLVPFCVRALGL